MKANYTKTFLGAVLAFIIATSCCWIPGILIGAVGASLANALIGGLNVTSYIFFGVGLLLIAYAGYLYFNRKSKEVHTIITSSTIICPECGYSATENMPLDACQYFYECEKCHSILKPKDGDCCVFCSYGNVPCPPIQADKECC